MVLAGAGSGLTAAQRDDLVAALAEYRRQLLRANDIDGAGRIGHDIWDLNSEA